MRASRKMREANESAGKAYTAAAQHRRANAIDRISETENTVATLVRRLGGMPVNVTVADPDDFTITFVNKTGLATPRPLQSLPPVPVEQPPRTCIAVLHDSPSRQRRVLGRANNLPRTANITLGARTLRALAEIPKL